MRLSKVFWLILGAGIFVIAAAGLYILYQDQNREQQELSDSLAVAQATLPQLTSEKEGLESQLARLEEELAQARSLLDEAKAEFLILTEFPGSVESIEYDEALFALADDTQLEIISLTVSGPRTVTEENITYPVTSFTVAVAGERTDILYFIHKIATDEDFRTTTVESVNIATPVPLTKAEKDAIKEEIGAGLTEEDKEGLTEEEIEELVEELAAEVIEEREMPSATINLVIYGYRG